MCNEQCVCNETIAMEMEKIWKDSWIVKLHFIWHERSWESKEQIDHDRSMMTYFFTKKICHQICHRFFTSDLHRFFQIRAHWAHWAHCHCHVQITGPLPTSPQVVNRIVRSRLQATRGVTWTPTTSIYINRIQFMLLNHVKSVANMCKSMRWYSNMYDYSAYVCTCLLWVIA